MLKPTNYSKTDLTHWDVIELKRVVQDAINGTTDYDVKHFRAVFGPATVMWLLNTLEGFIGDDLK